MPVRFALGERASGVGVERLDAGRVLKPTDGDVNVMWLDLDRTRSTTGSLSGQKRSARPGEGIKDDPAPIRAIEDRIGHERDGFYGRVHFERLIAIPAEGVDTRIVPDICPVSPVTSQRNIVDVSAVADFEDRDEFVF